MGQASFTLTCVGPKHLEIGCDDGHRFVFNIVREPQRPALLIGETHWNDSVEPDDPPQVLEEAFRFATICAEDFGLR